jgi:hypothetical protein
VKDKIILAIMLLLMSGCSMTGDGSKWKNMGPEQVKCQKHEFKMCGRYGSLHICECKLA